MLEGSSTSFQCEWQRQRETETNEQLKICDWICNILLCTFYYILVLQSNKIHAQKISTNLQGLTNFWLQSMQHIHHKLQTMLPSKSNIIHCLFITVRFSDPNNQLWIKCFSIPLSMHQLHGGVLQALFNFTKDALIPAVQHKL